VYEWTQSLLEPDGYNYHKVSFLCITCYSEENQFPSLIFPYRYSCLIEFNILWDDCFPFVSKGGFIFPLSWENWSSIKQALKISVKNSAHSTIFTILWNNRQTYMHNTILIKKVFYLKTSIKKRKEKKREDNNI
jgi:hypothetical protein